MSDRSCQLAVCAGLYSTRLYVGWGRGLWPDRMKEKNRFKYALGHASLYSQGRSQASLDLKGYGQGRLPAFLSTTRLPLRSGPDPNTTSNTSESNCKRPFFFLLRHIAAPLHGGMTPHQCTAPTEQLQEKPKAHSSTTT